MSRMPFTEKLLVNSEKDIYSFHALPISRGEGIEGSQIEGYYKRLLGSQFLSNELTYTDGWIDNPVFPKDVLKESELITSKSFLSNRTLYITSGTTLSNYISIFGLIDKQDRILVDRTCHQSIHFAITKLNMSISYSKIKEEYSHSGRVMTDYVDLIKKCKDAMIEGNPFSLIVLNSSSYEGVQIDVYNIMYELLRINENVKFLIDEAWNAYQLFNKRTKYFSCMSSCHKLSKKFKNLQVISTQSAHKSLSSLRQGSYIHIFGNQKLIDKMERIKFQFHTTSPSYPIIASLELAREQMVLEGQYKIDSCFEYAREIKRIIKNSNNLFVNKENDESGYNFIDPLKISINFSKVKKMSPREVKELMQKFNVYFTRMTETSILLNIHIGIHQKHIDRLKQFLLALDMFQFESELPTDKEADFFLIPYPPGVPLVVPGDRLGSNVINKIKKYEESGATLIKVVAKKVNK